MEPHSNLVPASIRIRELEMTAFTLKNIPDELYNDLRAAARLHHRSINSEILVCLEKSLGPVRVTAEDRLKRIQSIRKSISFNDISIDEIKDAIHSGRA